jgi:membrane protease YdiL (CAAX protease family)
MSVQARDIGPTLRDHLVDMKVGVVAVAIGLPVLGIGVFLIGDRSGRMTTAAYVLGLLLLSLGVARLFWAGWHGSVLSWVIAAPVAAVLAWTLYELVRQEVRLYGIGILGEMTAPTLSAAVGVGALVAGWLRHGKASRDRVQS